MRAARISMINGDPWMPPVTVASLSAAQVRRACAVAVQADASHPARLAADGYATRRAWLEAFCAAWEQAEGRPFCVG